MLGRAEEALPVPDLMQWLIEHEREAGSDELLYWFSRLARDSRFKRERLPRAAYHTREHQISLCSYQLTESETPYVR
mgnify:CR=1 FL=1